MSRHPLLALATTLVGALVTVAPAQAATPGEEWVAAMKANRAAAAAKVTVTKDLKYGIDGRNQVIADKVDKHLAKLLPALKKLFGTANVEKVSCTTLGRELGFISGEWKEKSETMSEWIRQIPEPWCSDPTKEPELWLVKVTTDLPHAIVLMRPNIESPIAALSHF